jgi:glycosyltransferase involved in cell wall biosynthesis
MRVIFVLPGRGGGGGAHSVVQETLGLQKLGVDVAIAASQDSLSVFRTTYPELEHHHVPVPTFRDDAELRTRIEGYDLAIATTAPSANQLAAAVAGIAEGRRPRTGYYVQDYEPLFFTPGTPEWAASRTSYTALPNCLLMAKTNWLCATVHENHNRQVVKVSPSIDHSVYHPSARPEADRLTITAMIRPKTPRRAPRRTVRILERLAADYGDQVRITTFGCERADLELNGLRLSPGIEHSGVLSRRQVAATLRVSDLFLDLSDFQAFGRTGLEGMACGCIPVLPVFGGTDEYARHRQNAFLVDTRSDEAILEAVHEFVANSAAIRKQMRHAAIATALDYSIERAAFSEYEAFSAFLGDRVS